MESHFTLLQSAGDMMIKIIKREKDLLREKLEKDTKKFLKRGGRIKKIPTGETGMKNLNKNVTRQHRKREISST
jgi:hypothetical protein